LLPNKTNQNKIDLNDRKQNVKATKMMAPSYSA